MNNRYQTLKEIYGKHRIIKLFDKKPFRLVELVIPLDTYTKMSYLYLLCKESKVGVSFMVDFLFNFGVEIFITAIEKYSLKNIFHLMKMKTLIMNTIDTYFKKSLNRYPLIELTDYKYIEGEFERRKFTFDQKLEFLEFVRLYDKTFIDKEKLLLDQKDISELFTAYANIEKETYSYDFRNTKSDKQL